MRRRLPVMFALACLACYALGARNASAAGSHGGGSAPAPAPSGGSAHGGGGYHGGGSSGGGGSARGGSSRGGGSSNGSGRSYGSGSGHGSGPVYGGGGARGGGGGGGNGGGISRVHGSTGGSTAPGYLYRPPSQQAGFGASAKAGTVERVREFRWACRGPGGVYYSFAGPCEDSEEVAAVGQQVGIARTQPSGYENGTDYATDPFAVGLVPGAGTARVADLPILTRNTEAVAPYAVILRDGMAFASVERPTQSGKMVVGRDRSGNLFSIRASEVDLKATKPAAPAH
jgi:hypothetical protein